MLFEMGGGKRGGLCLLKESSVLISGLAGMGRFRGEAGHCAAAFQCRAVPQVLVQAVTILGFVNILTSQFPEYFCYLFIPALYLY